MDEDESGDDATLTVGPTSGGMVRILIEDGGRQIPMDFEPDEAEEIADELRAAAGRARAADRPATGRARRQAGRSR